MLRGKVTAMREDQRGFTIVELLIVVAILSIVILSVCGFILVGSRSYVSANSDISVQQEAQLALNQMSDVLIDTTRSVNYVGYDTSGSPVLALKDAEFGFEPVAKSLIMYNGVPVETAVPGGTSTTTIEEGNGNKHYHFYWDKSDETLYYTELEVQSTDVKPGDIHFPAFGDPGWVVLAEHVTKFEADLTQVEEKRVVQLELTFVNGQREYNTSNNVTIRNKVAVNDAEVGPLNRKKTLSVFARDKGVIIEPGESFHFSTPKVTGENVTDRSVTWSIVSCGSGDTKFTDTANGFLQVATSEPAGTIRVAITTNAADSDGNHASCIVEVYIKRVTGYSLKKTEDSDSSNGDLEISPGCTFTITAADFSGFKLGEVCTVCGDDIDMDKSVVGEGNPYGNPYKWLIYNQPGWDPREFIDILESEKDHATFYVKPNAPWDDEGNGIYHVVIQSMSLLSTQDNSYGRHYDWWVPGAIELTLRSSGMEAEPISGLLQYGDETLINDIKGNLSTEGHEYVTCIRVVDNSTVDPEPDRILLYFTIGHGADYRVVPDMFDLDLSRSYTFYMQALDPVSKEKHQQGNHHQADSKQEIWNEYINHLSTSKPYGYVGDKYDYNKVYYSVLEKPRAIWNYNGIDYKGKDIVLDPINVYSLSVGNGIIKTKDVVPYAYENIWHEARTQDKMTYSVYVGEGDRSQWTPLYVFNGESMSYEGSTRVGDGVGILNIKNEPGNPGDPFFKMENGDRMKLCGNYHVVTGLCYDNISDRTLTGDYDIIGWQGFSCDGQGTFALPHELRHYEFDDSVIHVNINAEFTMDINDDWFKGQVLFPLPYQMAKNSIFPNLESMDWQNSGGSLSVAALREGQTNSENMEFTYVSYRYVAKNKTYEVEPVKVEYRFENGKQKIVTHSYGTYVCGENGKKWEFKTAGYTKYSDLVCNVKNFEYNGGQYQTYYPLPTDADFPFKGGSGEKYYSLSLYNGSMENKGTVSGVLVKCTKTGDSYEIQFIKKTKDNPYDPDNHKTSVFSYGTYTWSPGQTQWSKKEGSKELPGETDLVVNLVGLERDGMSFKMYFPLPTESDFLFKGNKTEITNYCPVAYETKDLYGEHADKHRQYTVRCEHTGDTYTISFYNPWNNDMIYGKFQWKAGELSWKKIG